MAIVRPFLSELNVKLPIVNGPIGILTLKRRTLSPVAQLFIDCAHEAAEPLVRHRCRFNGAPA